MKPTINFPNDFPVLQTQRLNLSAYTVEDALAFFELRSNVEFMHYLGMYPMKELSEAEERVEATIKSFDEREGISWKISLKNNAELIGYIGFWRIDFSNSRAEVGFGIHPTHQQKGYMLEALKEVVRFGFETLNIHSVMADIDPNNTGSVKLLKKAQFRKEAHLRESYYFDGEFTDSDYYCMINSDFLQLQSQ